MDGVVHPSCLGGTDHHGGDLHKARRPVLACDRERVHIHRRRPANRNRLRPVFDCTHSSRGLCVWRGHRANALGLPETDLSAGSPGMKWSRREILKMAANSGSVLSLPAIESSCIQGRPQPRLLASRAPIPKPFQATLPPIPVLKPVRGDSSTDYYELTAQETKVQILPGLTTRIWGYNGRFPAPTIEARSGRCISLRLRNGLPVPIVNHLHGGHTPPESDGYPTDFVLPPGFALSHLHDPMARVVQQQRDYVYPNQQRAATL